MAWVDQTNVTYARYSVVFALGCTNLPGHLKWDCRVTIKAWVLAALPYRHVRLSRLRIGG